MLLFHIALLLYYLFHISTIQSKKAKVQGSSMINGAIKLLASRCRSDYNCPMDQHNNKAAIDEIDRKIIEALQIDGRRPFTKLAVELGISEASVRQRVANLINTHVMQIAAITNPVKLGFSLACMIGIRVSGDRLLEVAKEIAEFEEII